MYEFASPRSTQWLHVKNYSVRLRDMNSVKTLSCFSR
jgi:hypothetical protein